MNIIIAYKTKTGGSKQYAEWLAGVFGVEAKTFKQIKKDDLKACDACAVISGTYAGLMPLNRFLKKYWKILRDKKVAAVALGALEPNHKWSQWSYNRIPEPIRGKIKYWKLPGKGNDKKPIKWGEIKPENLEPIIEYLRPEEKDLE